MTGMAVLTILEVWLCWNWSCGNPIAIGSSKRRCYIADSPWGRKEMLKAAVEALDIMDRGILIGAAHIDAVKRPPLGLAHAHPYQNQIQIRQSSTGSSSFGPANLLIWLGGLTSLSHVLIVIGIVILLLALRVTLRDLVGFLVTLSLATFGVLGVDGVEAAPLMVELMARL